MGMFSQLDPCFGKQELNKQELNGSVAIERMCCEIKDFKAFQSLQITILQQLDNVGFILIGIRNDIQERVQIF